MADSKIALCNMALQHLAVSKEIASFTDKVKEARVCNRFYNQVRDEVLRDFPWPFATRFVNLQVVEENPTTEWLFSYRYPPNCSKLRRLLNQVSRNETRKTRVPHRTGQDDQGILIFTDLVNAQAEYTYLVDDPTKYPADFAQSFALLLATYIAPGVTSGDQFKLGARAMQLYQWRTNAARTNGLSEEQDDLPPESDLLSSREGDCEDSRWTFR